MRTEAWKFITVIKRCIAESWTHANKVSSIQLINLETEKKKSQIVPRSIAFLFPPWPVVEGFSSTEGLGNCILIWTQTPISVPQFCVSCPCPYPMHIPAKQPLANVMTTITLISEYPQALSLHLPAHGAKCLTHASNNLTNTLPVSSSCLSGLCSTKLWEG